MERPNVNSVTGSIFWFRLVSLAKEAHDVVLTLINCCWRPNIVVSTLKRRSLMGTYSSKNVTVSIEYCHYRKRDVLNSLWLLQKSCSSGYMCIALTSFKVILLLLFVVIRLTTEHFERGFVYLLIPFAGLSDLVSKTTSFRRCKIVVDVQTTSKRRRGLAGAGTLKWFY